MKRIMISLGLALALSFGATLNEGITAIENDDYQTAKSIFEDLAAKNDADAQTFLGLSILKE